MENIANSNKEDSEPPPSPPSKRSFAVAMEEVEERKEDREFRELQKEIAAKNNPGIPDTRPVLYLPVDDLTEPPECNDVFYKGCALTKEFFYRDGTFSYVEEDREAGTRLWVLEPSELVRKIASVFSLRKKFYNKETGAVQEKRVNLQLPEAGLILKDYGTMRRYSRRLRLLSTSPILVEQEGKPEILHRGYHDIAGGVYVTDDLEIPTMTLEKAKRRLLDLFRDYDFVSPGDLSRAIAHLLSAALKLGNLLETDYPFNVVIADKEQSGKGHLFKIIATVYGEKIYVIAKKRGGVGSFDESVGAALLSAKLFVLVDNARGDIDSQILESILKGLGVVEVRVPYRGSLEVSTRRCLWGLTSNVANFTKDLAARSLIVSHRKQPPDYQAQSSLGWGDGVLVNLARRRAEYLGAVFAVVGEWIRRGKPRTDERRHAFRDWVQALDYIVQEILGLAPLMDGQSTAQQILSNPAYGWLRAVALKVDETNQLGATLQAGDLGDLCEEEDISIPGLRELKATSLTRRDERNKQVGINLRKIFGDIPPAKNPPPGAIELRSFELETYEVERWEERAPGETKPTKKYRFVKIQRKPGSYPT